MGRPTKLTPEVQDKIVNALRAGNYQETAAKYAGISDTTFYEWIERGKADPDGLYGEFWVAVEKAKSDAEVRDIALIDKAASEGTWQAAAWKLERRHPERWGKPNRAEASKSDDADAELERFLASLSA